MYEVDWSKYVIGVKNLVCGQVAKLCRASRLICSRHCPTVVTIPIGVNIVVLIFMLMSCWRILSYSVSMKVISKRHGIISKHRVHSLDQIPEDFVTDHLNRRSTMTGQLCPSISGLQHMLINFAYTCILFFSTNNILLTNLKYSNVSR